MCRHNESKKAKFAADDQARRDAFESQMCDELRRLREELGRRSQTERKLREELGRLHAWTATSEARDAAALDMTRNEFRALRQDQICLAEHATMERVATAAAMQAVRVIYLCKS